MGGGGGGGGGRLSAVAGEGAIEEDTIFFDILRPAHYSFLLLVFLRLFITSSSSSLCSETQEMFPMALPLVLRLVFQAQLNWKLMEMGRNRCLR